MENKPTTSKIIQLQTIVTNNYEFIIPIYQRLYSWDEKQIIELLDDIKNAGDEYFIGNVVTCKKDGFYHLVDGQQRLSTILFLCIWYCKNKIKNSNEIPSDEKIRKIFDFAFLQENNTKNHYDRCRIQMPLRKDDENALFWYKFDEIKNPKITNALKIFNKHLQNGDEFFANLLEKVKINFIELGSGINLNEYFVRMNSTGVKLSPVDILKARLLKLIDKKEFSNYANIFDECSQMDRFANFNNHKQYKKLFIDDVLKITFKDEKSKKSKNDTEFKSIIDFSTFILHVFKILYKDKNIKIDKNKFLENTWDKVKNDIDSEEAKKIINTLKEYRIIFDVFVTKKINKSEYEDYNFFYKNNKNVWVIDNSLKELQQMQNYLIVSRNEQGYHHFLSAYLLRCFGLVAIKSNQGDFSKSLTKGIDKISVKNVLNAYSLNLLEFLRHLDNHLAVASLNNSSLLEIADNFENILDKKIPFAKKVDNVVQNIKYNIDFSKLENILNKGTNTPHYWFYRLEYYLLTTYKWNEKQTERIKKEFKFRYLNSVEHILARQEEHGAALQNQELLDVFGNIALISKSENSSYSNQNFKKKQIDFNKNQLSSLKLLDVYSYENWDSDKIKEHQTKMLDILKNSFKN